MLSGTVHRDVRGTGLVAARSIAVALLARRRATARRRPPRPVRRAAATRSRARTASRAPTRPIWDIDGAGDATIQGFATDISVNVGQTDRLQDRHRRLGVHDRHLPARLLQRRRRPQDRHGHPVGDAAADTSRSASPTSPPSSTTAATGRVSASWNVPATAVSGVYIAQPDARRQRRREPHHVHRPQRRAATPTCVFQTSDPTWQAYNTYGGSDFYQGAANGRAYKISYNRPFATRGGIGGRDFFFSNEYPMVRFLERNGYDVSYIAGVDTDRRGSLLTQPQGLPVRRPRRVLDAARSAPTSRPPATPA